MVTHDDVPKRVTMEPPTFVQASLMRHVGLVRRGIDEEPTHARVEKQFMVKDQYRRGMTSNDTVWAAGQDRTTVRVYHNGPVNPPLQTRKPSA
jgi:hypothetical protein